MQAKKQNLLQIVAAILSVMLLFTACSSKATNAADKIELGQKYLTELKYTEAVAAFTEVIGLDPDNIEAYMGRAEAYKGLKQYDDAKADYTTAIEKTDEMPYTQAQAYTGRAEVYELTDESTAAESDYSMAIGLLDEEDVGKIENIAEALIRELKIKVLQLHAEICEKLGLYDKAMEDYAKLAELGVDVPEQEGKGEEYTKTSILNEINEMRAEKGCDSVILDDMCQSEADECALLRKKEDEGLIDREEAYQRTDSIYASVRLKCDTWMMTFGTKDLAAGNPEYTKVSIGIPEEENRLDIGEYIVVIYY